MNRTAVRALPVSYNKLPDFYTAVQESAVSACLRRVTPYRRLETFSRPKAIAFERSYEHPIPLSSTDLAIPCRTRLRKLALPTLTFVRIPTYERAQNRCSASPRRLAAFWCRRLADGEIARR
jgi:hypothetical protein